MSITLDGRYVLQGPRYYRQYFRQDSERLYRAAWNQYRRYLNGSIDDPHNDQDVIAWLESIIAEKVNDSRSRFYLKG